MPKKVKKTARKNAKKAVTVKSKIKKSSTGKKRGRPPKVKAVEEPSVDSEDDQKASNKKRPDVIKF
jgi:hypothetical protein